MWDIDWNWCYFVVNLDYIHVGIDSYKMLKHEDSILVGKERKEDIS